MKSREDSAPQQLQYILYFIEKNIMMIFYRIKEERTHIHFITRLEMKLLVVIVDSDSKLRKNESNPIFWLNNYLMMIFELANNGF